MFFWIWIEKNLYWIVPTIITGIFSLLIFVLTRRQTNLQNKSIQISKQQTDIQQQSIKLALWEKRYEIYLNIKIFLASIMQNDGIYNNDDINDFLKKTRDSSFLFESDIPSLIDEIYDKARRLLRLCKTSKQSEIDEHFELVSWFTEKSGELQNIFDKYLNVNKLGL